MKEQKAYLSVGPWVFWICSLLFAAIAVSLTAQATCLYGVGVTPDSTRYIELARDITEHGVRFLGEPKAISQPFAYPLVLAIISKATGRDALVSAYVVNLASLGTLVVLIMLSVRTVTSFLPVLLATGILSCFSIPLIHVSTMAWSEPIFIVMVYAILLIVTSSGNSLTVSLILGLLTGLACFTRYAGIVLIPLLLAYLILFLPHRRSDRLKSGLVFLCISLLVVGLYIVRNIAQSGTVLGEREPSPYSLISNLILTTKTLMTWFFPWYKPTFPMVMLGLLFAFVAAIVFYYNRRSVFRKFRDAHRPMLAYVGFATIYVAFIVITSTTTAYDRINDRLLSPVYPAILVLFAVFLRPQSRSRKERIVSIAAVCGFTVLFATWPVYSVFNEIQAKAKRGAGGYNKVTWRESQLLTCATNTLKAQERKVFCNAPEALYILAGLKAQICPARQYHKSGKATGTTSENLFKKFPDFEGAFLVWFDKGIRPHLFTPEELNQICTVVPVVEAADGTIYLIQRFN